MCRVTLERLSYFWDKIVKTFLPEDQHIEKQDICPYNILTTQNFANTMHSDNDKMQCDHMALIEELVRKIEFEF